MNNAPVTGTNRGLNPGSHTTPASDSGMSQASLSQSADGERVNVISSSPVTGLISNFAATPFVLEDRHFNSVEAFIQYIKYPEADPAREHIASLEGVEARRAGTAVNRENFSRLAAGEPVFVYWNNEAIPYRSEQHFQLIESAIRAKFEQNPDAAAQLLETGQAVLYHDTGHPESPHSSLPATVFCRMLSIIRDELSIQPS